VRAPRSITSELKAENIIATADVNELSSLDTISIKLSTNIANQRDITLIPSHDIIRLKIENKRSKALALKASVTGSVEDGYMIGDISTDQNLVRISGPESVIDQVVRATANVDMDITGVTSDNIFRFQLTCYGTGCTHSHPADIVSPVKHFKYPAGIRYHIRIKQCYGNIIKGLGSGRIINTDNYQPEHHCKQNRCNFQANVMGQFFYQFTFHL